MANAKQMRKTECDILFNLTDTILTSYLKKYVNSAGEKLGCHKPMEVMNEDYAEIDDIRVIRNGDHLFFVHELEAMDSDVT